MGAVLIVIAGQDSLIGERGTTFTQRYCTENSDERASSLTLGASRVSVHVLIASLTRQRTVILLYILLRALCGQAAEVSTSMMSPCPCPS